MNYNRLGILAIAGGMLLGTAAAASAGGFARGTADTDILYEPGNFAMRSGVTFVSPTRKFSEHYDGALVGEDYTETYTVPSVAFKVEIFDPLSCAGTYTQAYGGEVSYENRITAGKLTEEFTVDEFAVTCATKFGLGKGNFYVLGGVFEEQFNYGRSQLATVPLPSPPFPPGATTLAPASLMLDGTDHGYRLGVAYDIPEIAFRTQLLYRSGTSYGATGQFNLPLAGVSAAALGSGTLPQSIELDIQSGIAPGWLAFASVKWTDWSVMDALRVEVPTFPLANSEDLYNWRDGWTVTGGVGHAFNERVSGLASITWDRGVGTGYDLSSDTWTLALGGSVKDDIGGQFRAGVGFSYLTSAEETQYGPENTAVDDGWAVALNVGYSVNW